MKRRMLSLAVVIAMVFAMLPNLESLCHAVDDPYYDEYGVTYEQLFTLYPGYLKCDVEDQVTDIVISTYTDVLCGQSSGDDFIASYAYFLRENAGFSIGLREIWAGLNLGVSTEEQLTLESITLLMENISESGTAVTAVAEKVSESFSLLKDTYDLNDDLVKNDFIKQIKNVCKWTSDEQVEALMDVLLSKEVENTINGISVALEICDYLIAIVALHELEMGIVETIKSYVPQESGIKEAIDSYIENRGSEAAIRKTYGSEALLKLVGEGLLKLAGPVGVAINVMSLAAKVLYQGPDAADVYRATALSGYVQGIYSAVLTKRIEFSQTTLVGADEIAEYQVLYIAYIESIRTTLESTLPLATEIQQGNINKAISICDKLTYDKYIRLCMENVKEDINAGLVAAPGGIAGNISACVKETYPSYGTIVITKESANIMDRPCSVNTDATAQLVESGSLNAEYTATGLYLNTADNYWYQIITKSGKTGYIYSGNCEHKEFLSDATLTGLDVPSQIDVGSRYYIKGTVSTTYTNFSSVSFLVYDQNGTLRTGGTVNTSGKSYVLDNSTLDAAVEYNALPAGTYRNVIQAQLLNYSATACWAETVTLHTSEFVVGNGTSSESAVRYTDLLLDINWGNIDQVGRQTPYSYSCSCFALAYSRTILDNAVHYFYEYNEYGNTEYSVNALWYVGQHNSAVYSSSNEVFQKLYSDLCNGKPVIVYVTGRGSSGHYVTVVGFQNISSLENLSEYNFLIIDPVFNDGHVAVNMGGVGYSLNSYRQVVYDQSSASVSFSATNNLACNHNYILVETPASCTADGIREYTCASCGDVYSELIEALGHDYIGTNIDATCTNAGYTIYTCSRCSDSYEETVDGWSEWSTEYPAGISESLIETKTQYSTREKEYTTSISNTLEGWTSCGFTYSDWGPVQTATTKPTESDVLRITNTEQTGWGYYHWCNYYYNGGTNWNVDSVRYGSSSYWHGYTSNFALPAFSFQDKGGQQAYGGTGSGAGACAYYFYVWFRDVNADVYTYSYQTRSQVNQFYRWEDAWSDWSDEPVIATEERQVQMRTLYRYYVGELAEHDYKASVTSPTCTVQGYTTYTCSACGDSYKDDYVEAAGHSFGQVTVHAPAPGVQGYSEHTCTECGFNEKFDYVDFQGVCVSGTVTSYLADGDVTVQLVRGNQVIYSTVVNGSTVDYVIENVEPGTYTLEVQKANHAARSFEIVVGDTDVTQDVKICPKGDVTGDGVVNIKDFQRLLRHVNKTNPLTGYALACGDVTGDGVCNIKDFQRLLRHVNKTNPLF